MDYSLRSFHSSDAARLNDIFHNAVRIIGARRYASEQIAAWLASLQATESL